MKTARLALCALALSLAGCSGLVTLANCADDRSHYRAPESEVYTYDLEIAYLKNNEPKKLRTTLQCKHTGTSCNAASGLHDNWQRVFENGSDTYTVEQLGENTALTARAPSCYPKPAWNERITLYSQEGGTLPFTIVEQRNGKRDAGYTPDSDHLKTRFGIEQATLRYTRRP